MNKYHERTYRKRVTARDIAFFHVAVKQTDLWVGAEKNLEAETRDAIGAFLSQLRQKGTSIVVSTHDEGLMCFAKHRYVIVEGRLAE